ncbi:NepR family anti-sigma factor [Oricola cellulosilytica]|uniref:Anti-sigma factor NepR domain-containing protein n=2 Tax=Oricola cellulosilytica TaxID=1429082 RepID=A0A4R0PHN4_9HYPH|nr:NepR family anti-sigma factor [Oricola cellulosilytica]TCD15084.1 hypothetical protein E0D97_05925 [Oricola cellulosilytica]
MQPIPFSDVQGLIGGKVMMTAIMGSTHSEMPSEGKKPPKVDELATSQIGKRLRHEFDAVLNEPVPDRFRDLLKKLEEAEEGSGGTSRDE